MNRDRHVIDEEFAALLNDPLRLFLKNRETMKIQFPGQGALMHSQCALMCAGRAILLDGPRVQDMRGLVRSRTGAFAYFRGIPLMPLSTLLSQSLMPESELERVLQSYDALRQAGFSGSPYLAETAFLPFMLEKSPDMTHCAAAAYDMYRAQRQARPWLGTDTACLYALLAAAAGQDGAEVGRETECSYPLLKITFPTGGTTYALARVLALGPGEATEKCARVVSLYQTLRAAGLRWGRRYELPALGALSLQDEDAGAIADGIAKMDARLRAEKGFSAWTLPPAQRLIFAGSLYVLEHENKLTASEPEQRPYAADALAAAQLAACTGAYAAAASAASAGNG